jgi:large subunit ribosomal protein L35
MTDSRFLNKFLPSRFIYRKNDSNFEEEKIMPKIKSNSGAKKRFKMSKNGKPMRAHAYKSHILNKKTTKRKRNLRKVSVADKTNVKQIKKLVPYK